MKRHLKQRIQRLAAASSGMLMLMAWATMGHAAATGQWVVADFARYADVPAGNPFYRWMAENGWQRGIGDPRFFFIRDGQLHLVSKPGPVYEARYRLALFDREKLLRGIENKVLVRITPEGFRIDSGADPQLQFVFTPLKLPAKAADLRDSDKNDAAFYLLVFFDSTAREFEGIEIPESVAYVWANRRWSEPTASDPDYADFMRYIAVGFGNEGLGRRQTVARRIAEDYRLAFPERENVPDIAGFGLMIDSNTLGGAAESALSCIRVVTPPAPDGPAASPSNNPTPQTPTF